jgi:hypothetical protein
MVGEGALSRSYSSYYHCYSSYNDFILIIIILIRLLIFSYRYGSYYHPHYHS